MESFERKDQLVFASLVSLKTYRSYTQENGTLLVLDILLGLKMYLGAHHLGFLWINQQIFIATCLKPRIVLKKDCYRKELCKDIATWLEIIRGANIFMKRE